MRTDDSVLRRIAPGMLNASCPLPGLATGGQPTAADLQGMARAGYRTILDLREPVERRGYDELRAAHEAGLEYVALPVGHGPLADELFERFRTILRDAARRPLLVHCASGNRVGAMLIPYLVLDEGRSPREALESAVEAGLSSPPLAQMAIDYVRRQGADASGADRVA